MHIRSSVRALGRAAAAVVVFVLAVLTSAAAAAAHDSLTGAAPADGDTVAAMPEAVELTFSNPPVELGSEISIQDESGTEWADGPVEIVGETVSQPVKAGAPAGEYTVTWRVVSSDSHPIEGVYTFTATGPAGAGLGTPAPLESPAQEPAGEQVETEEAATTFPTSVVVVMGAVLVVLVIVIALLARRRLGGGPNDTGR